MQPHTVCAQFPSLLLQLAKDLGRGTPSSKLWLDPYPVYPELRLATPRPDDIPSLPDPRSGALVNDLAEVIVGSLASKREQLVEFQAAGLDGIFFGP